MPQTRVAITHRIALSAKAKPGAKPQDRPGL